MEEGQQPEQRLSSPPQPTVIHGQIQVLSNFSQTILYLRAQIQTSTHLSAFTSCQRYRRTIVTTQVVALHITAVVGVLLILCAWRPGSQEIMLQHGGPATGLHIFVGAVLQIIKSYFFVTVFFGG